MSSGTGRSRVEAELAEVSPSAVTVRVVQAALGAIPESQPIPWYGTLEQAAELVFGGIPAHVTERAVALLDELQVDAALSVTQAVDDLDAGSPSQTLSMLTAAAPDTAARQRVDAAVKAHVLAYLFAQLLPGETHRARIANLDTVPAARQFLQYFASIDVAVPFADEVRNADGTFVAALIGTESGALTGRLVELLGRDGLDLAKDMLQVLLTELDASVMQVLRHTPSLVTQVRGILPGRFGGTGTGAIVADTDRLPTYRWLGARLALESGLAAAKLELAPTHFGTTSRAMAPDRTAELPNPFSTPSFAPTNPSPPPVTAPPPAPIPDLAGVPGSEVLPSPFVPTFDPAPERTAEPAPTTAGEPAAEPEVYELMADATAEEPVPATSLESSPEPPPTAEEPAPVAEPSEPSGPNPFEPVAAHAEPQPPAEATVPPNPFDPVESARDVLEHMAPAEGLTNGAGSAMMLADALMQAGEGTEAEDHGVTDPINAAAEAAVELETVLTAGTTEWPSEPPPENPENPFLPDPDQEAGAPQNPFEQAAMPPADISPVDPFAVVDDPAEASPPTLVPDSLEVAETPTAMEQPLNPFALPSGELPAPPVAVSEAAPPDVPVGIVTASVAPFQPVEETPIMPAEAESPTLIPMPTDAARREVQAASAASADAPPAPPPTVTPTWPTAELPEEERLRGAYLSTDGKWRIFSKEGIVTTAPPATVAPIDWDVHWEAGHTIALYKRRGNHATIEYFDAVPESFTVEREPYSLKINGQTWRRADYDLSDRTMRGQWTSRDGDELILDNEGRITLDGRHGHYRLGAGRIDVTWDGGDTWVASFLSTLAPSSRHPQVLWLAGSQYTLRA